MQNDSLDKVSISKIISGEYTAEQEKARAKVKEEQQRQRQEKVDRLFEALNDLEGCFFWNEPNPFGEIIGVKKMPVTLRFDSGSLFTPVTQFADQTIISFFVIDPLQGQVRDRPTLGENEAFFHERGMIYIASADFAKIIRTVREHGKRY